MKKIKFIALFIISLISINSCQDDDGLTYIAEPSGEFAFSNTFLSEYILTTDTKGNLGERFTWNSADFGVQTNVSYELQSSIIGDFTDMQVVGTTSNNEFTLTIGDLLKYAKDAGLDNDPATTDNPNTGTVSFRLTANVGTDSSIEMITPTQLLTLVLPEDTGSAGFVCDFDQLWAVGAGLPTAGWGWTTPVQFSCLGNGIYAGNAILQNNAGADNNFRFFTSEGDWASGQNYPYFIAEGYTIDSRFEDALDGDNNFAFTGVTGNYYVEVNTNTKTITITDPQSYGTCEFDMMYGVGAGLPTAGWGWTTPVIFNCTGEGAYTAYITLQNNGGADNNFRFFTSEGDWASGRNYPYYVSEGYTIDPLFEDALDGDNNFAFTGTSGTYFITIDDVNKTITLE